MDKFYYFFRTSVGKNNFVNFGYIHIILLIIAFLSSIAIIKMKKENRLFEVFVGVILLIQQSVLYLWYIKGHYHVVKEGLPLFHCRIAIIALVIGLIFKKDFMMKIGSYLGIFCATSALLFIKLDPFSFPHITQISYFIGHIFLLLGSVYIVFVKKIGMNKYYFKKTLIVINCYHILIFVLNNIIGANYAYMKSSPIGIGNNLNPYLYGIVVMSIFNVILIIEYIIMNRNKYDALEENYEFEILNT